MLLTWRNHTLCWHLVIEVSFFSSYAVTKRALVKRNLLQRFLLLFSYLRKWHFWGPVSQQRMIGSAKNWYHVKLHAKSYKKGGSHFCVTCVLHDAFASRSFSFLVFSSSSSFFLSSFFYVAFLAIMFSRYSQNYLMNFQSDFSSYIRTSRRSADLTFWWPWHWTLTLTLTRCPIHLFGHISKTAGQIVARF